MSADTPTDDDALSSLGVGAALARSLAAHAGAVYVARSEGQRGLFARRDFSAGEDIVVESAAVVQAGLDATGALSAAAGWSDADVDGLLSSLAPHCGAPACSSRSELIRLAFSHNAFGVGAPAGGTIAGAYGQGGSARALFPVCAMANHDCSPNARTFQRDGAVRVLQARRPVRAGDEVRIAYVPPTWHKAVRAARLAGAYGFTCACARCSAAHDDTIAARCPSCANGRVFLGAPACADCGAAPPDAPALHRAAADTDSALAPFALGARPRELVAMLSGGHETLAPEDVRLWLTGCDLLPQLAPAPALAAALSDALKGAAARMGYVDPEEHGVGA